MNKKDFFPVIVLMVISVTLIGFTKGTKMDDQLSDQGKSFYGFMQKEGKILGTKYGMRLSSVGGGGGKDRIWLMSISFQRRTTTPLTEKESRSLIIKVVNEYLEAVNNDEILRPHLTDYPFTAKNVKITIYNLDEKGNRVYYPSVLIVGSDEGKIGYYTKEESKRFGYKTEKYETYDEAIAILKHENL